MAVNAWGRSRTKAVKIHARFEGSKHVALCGASAYNTDNANPVDCKRCLRILAKESR